jgi:O-antigen/teichoic acid export membrane protein
VRRQPLNQFATKGRRAAGGPAVNIPAVPLSPAHFIRSFLTLSAAQGLTWLGGAAMAVFLPRYLGDANLGKIAFALAFTSLIGLVADLGTATFLTREVARAPERVLALTTNTLVIRLSLGAVAVSVAIVTINSTPYDTLSRQVVYVMSAGIVVVSLSSAVVAALQGLQRIKSLALFSIATKLGYAALALMVLFAGAGPLEVAGAWVISQTIGLVLVTALLAQALGRWPRPSPDPRTMRLLVLGGLPFFMWQAALLVYGQVDAVLLSFLTQDAVVGWYSAAYRIVTIPLFLPTIIMTVIFPALAAASHRGEEFNAIARRAIQVVLLPSIPMVLGIMLLADKLIGFMGYPESFGHSVLPMVLLAPHIILVGVNMVIGTVLQTRERQRGWALAAIVAAILNPALNFVAITYSQRVFGNGAIGASVITTLTEVFMLGAGLSLLPRGVFGLSTIKDASRCLLAGVAMTGVVVAGRELPLPAVVAAGGAVYGLACLALGAVSLRELGQVVHHVLQRSDAEPIRSVELSATSSGTLS